MERHHLAVPLTIHARHYLLHDSLFCGGRPDRRLDRSEVAPALRYDRKRRRRKTSSARCSSSESQLSGMRGNPLSTRSPCATRPQREERTAPTWPQGSVPGTAVQKVDLHQDRCPVGDVRDVRQDLAFQQQRPLVGRGAAGWHYLCHRLEEPTGISRSVDTDRSRALLARRGFVFFDRCR